jgi:allantoate deiminase
MTTTARDVIDWCRRLAQCSEESGATTRTFLSSPMRDVHAQLSEWMRRAGLHVWIDAVGNLRGERPGTARNPRRLYFGSHLDTVPNAGAFDGVLGVVLAIAMVERLGDRRLPYDIEVVGFSEEEGVRFGSPFLGSRAFAGLLDESLLARRDAAGQSVADAIRAYGLDPARIGDARAVDNAIGYIEFHIEQGPVLDTSNLPLAIVHSIAGQSRASLFFEGAARHAGTTPMDLRRDALAGAAEWIVGVERFARSMPGMVATVGRIDAQPGVGNVVAGTCRASLDVRHADDVMRAAAVRHLFESAQEIAARRDLTVTAEMTLDQPAVAMNPMLAVQLERSVTRAGLPVFQMASGAGHDAMIAASRMPAGMLLLRTSRGISHHPDESVSEDAVEAALAVGGEFLDDVARDPSWLT